MTQEHLDHLTVGHMCNRVNVAQPLACTATYPKLAAHTLICFNETILVVHHGTILLFTSGVVTKSDENRLFLLQWLRKIQVRMESSFKTEEI